MSNAELEEVICGLHRRIALTTAGTPLQDDLIKAVGALRIAVNRIAELEAQMPKEGEWIPFEFCTDGTWHKCSVCGVAYRYKDPDKDRGITLVSKHNYCPNCGARMRGENNE